MTIRARAVLWNWWHLAVAPLFALAVSPLAASTADVGADKTRLVVVLYPDDNDGRPGNLAVDRHIRSTFAAGSSETVEVHNEYLDISRFQDTDYQEHLTEFLRRKYAGRKVDLVIAGLGSALDYALKYRDRAFPGVPTIFCAVDHREVKARKLPPDVIGVPIKMDLASTLDIALRLHPSTRRVFVITGTSRFDVQWEAEARKAFRAYEDKREFVYLAGMTVEELLGKVAQLPEQSIIYYLHVFWDDTGRNLIPAEVLERLAAKANVPIYGHSETYIGRGIVGGHVISFETAGLNAATLGLRILAGEKPENIGVQEVSENTYMFDWRRLRQWRISEANLPPGSDVRYREVGFWDLYKWHVLGVLALCVIEGLLIIGLLVQRANRRRAEEGLRESQRELRMLTGRLLMAQETERRHIARELHDDLSQSLALLSVELEMLGRPDSRAEGCIQGLSAHVKQLSSSVHDLSHQLHPAKLEQLGLLAAVGGLCKELARTHGIRIEFTHQAVAEAIPDDTALCLYRIVQEALGNVMKHSGARHAEVNLVRSGESLRLRIVDDGTGFDPNLLNDGGGLGLISMRERLRLVNGNIIIDSRPSWGTRIEVMVPLRVSVQSDGALEQQPATIIMARSESSLPERV